MLIPMVAWFTLLYMGVFLIAGGKLFQYCCGYTAKQAMGMVAAWDAKTEPDGSLWCIAWGLICVILWPALLPIVILFKAFVSFMDTVSGYI